MVVAPGIGPGVAFSILAKRPPGAHREKSQEGAASVQRLASRPLARETAPGMQSDWDELRVLLALARTGSLGVMPSKDLMAVLLANAGRLDKYGA